jgi:hypothetical protein
MLLHPICACKPKAKEEPKNIHKCRKFKKESQIRFNKPYINCQVRKIIADRVAGWNWEIDLGEECPFVTKKKNVVVGSLWMQLTLKNWKLQQLLEAT